MIFKETLFGKVYVLEQVEVFEYMLAKITALAHSKLMSNKAATIALSGGSTPQAFYKWVVANDQFAAKYKDAIDWFVSDERNVNLSSNDSNFGNLDRLFLTPLSIDLSHKHPWFNQLENADLTQKYNRTFQDRTCFDLCFLGMGDDCHTASLFPHSTLLNNSEDSSKYFQSIDVPGKGLRHTITPTGLSECSDIVVAITGNSKYEALKRVFFGPQNIHDTPIQLLGRFKEKVTWLIDQASARDLLDFFRN